MSSDVRKGQGHPHLERQEFRQRFMSAYPGAAYEKIRAQLEVVEQTAWEQYEASAKAPLTQTAGEGYHDPTYQLSQEWVRARDAIVAASVAHGQAHSPSRVLLICASPRNDKTCPGEMSKTFRLAQRARETLQLSCEVDLLDLSAVTSEFGRTIHPCKACVSTAMPLCHWPCSCYPNHSLGQNHDWMNEIYPRWVAAHGVLLLTPTHWYQAPSVLKLMMDRLVCADGGNPDPTLTHGKDAARAKAVERKGWNYPKHLAGRAFGVMVHGDAEGVGQVRQNLRDWLSDLGMLEAGEMGRYIGYYENYADSHAALDKDDNLMREIDDLSQKLVFGMTQIRQGHALANTVVQGPRPK